MEHANSRDRALTPLEQSLMEENDKLAAENAEHRKAASGDSMEVKTSLGSLKANGSVVVIILVVIASCCGIAFMVRDGDLRAQDRSASTDKKVESVNQKLEEAVYVLTLDERQRKDLKLDMPESLRRRTR